MMQHHKYSLRELEDMLPWEREIYAGLLAKFIEEENERIEKENQRMKQGGQLWQIKLPKLLMMRLRKKT